MTPYIYTFKNGISLPVNIMHIDVTSPTEYVSFNVPLDHTGVPKKINAPTQRIQGKVETRYQQALQIYETDETDETDAPPILTHIILFSPSITLEALFVSPYSLSLQNLETPQPKAPPPKKETFVPLNVGNHTPTLIKVNRPL